MYKNSKLIYELNDENIQDIIGVKLNEGELEKLQELQHQKVITINQKNRPVYSKTLSEYFEESDTKVKRNASIRLALEDGYTQSEIAKYLKLSRSTVSKIDW